ncbi:recombinase family protein [Flagellimonas halotolerans]
MGELLKYVRDGDNIVVWKLNRISRSLSHLTKLIKCKDVENKERPYNL